jgi:Na+-driven multidrug efflux pump
MMQLTAIVMPFDAITHSSYFTLRSGGKMSITILFDCGFMWGGSVLAAFILSRFTAMPILGIFAVVQGISVVKSIFGIILVKNGFWVRNIINKES